MSVGNLRAPSTTGHTLHNATVPSEQQVSHQQEGSACEGQYSNSEEMLTIHLKLIQNSMECEL